MASAAASTTATVVAFLSICLAVLLIIRQLLPLRTTPAFLLLPIFLALALPINALLLVPIDLASTSGTEDEASKGIWLAKRPLLVGWRLTYWLTFVLTWFVLPLLGEYMDAGYRDPKQRIIYSLRSNGRYQLIMLACAVLGLVYLIFDYGFDFTAIKGLLMALAYVWGLILAVYLAGHGMVALPRQLFRAANNAESLKRTQRHAARVHEKLDDASITLDDLEAQVLQLKQRKPGTAGDFAEWIDELIDLTAHHEQRIRANPAAMQASARVPAVITERYLADLTRRLERAQHQKLRYMADWDRVVQTATDLQAILDSNASKKLDFGRSKYKLLTPYLRHHLHADFLPIFRLALGTLLTLASAAVILSEVIRITPAKLSPVGLTVVHHPNDKDYQVGFGGQVLAAFWITYMCVCALSSVNDVPVWNGRALVRRNTHPEAACWYAGQVAKLTVPLSFNFLTFLPKDVHEKTVFYDFLGRLINLTPLGTWFDWLFPIFILVPVCATLFNLYGKIKNVLGFDIIDDDDDDDENDGAGYGIGGWREGRDLIAQDLNGHGASSLGLTDSPRPSLHQARPQRAFQTAIPTNTTAAAGSSSEPTASLNRSTRSRPPALDPEPAEENFFTLFGRRMKNTIDTIDTPKWMQNSGPTNFKKPKWMGGDDDHDGGLGGSNSTNHNRSSNQTPNFLGFFGGGGGTGTSNNGQITL